MSKKNDLSESVQRKYNDTENKWFMQNNEKIEFIINITLIQITVQQWELYSIQNTWCKCRSTGTHYTMSL